MYFQNLDVSVLLMYGRSTARQRVFAWAISVFLLASLLVLFWYAPVIPDEDIANTVQAFGSFVLEGFGGGSSDRHGAAAVVPDEANTGRSGPPVHADRVH